MSALGSRIEAAEHPAADSPLDAFKTIEPAERVRHEAVLDYWLSIRGSRELPPLRDLDPLEISDAASSSLLLELIGGGEDAEVRHIGETLKGGEAVEKVSEAARGSILASVARKLSIVAISRNSLAFEEDVETPSGKTRYWVTLLPLSAAGAWVDYVYAFVSLGDPAEAKPAPVEELAEELERVAPVQDEPVQEEAVADPVESKAISEVEAQTAVEDAPVEAEANEPEPAVAHEPEAFVVAEPQDAVEEVLELDSPVDMPDFAGEPVEELVQPTSSHGKGKAGFSFDAAVNGGFYGTQAVKVKPTLPAVSSSKAETPAQAEPKALPEIEDAAASVERESAALEPEEAQVIPQEAQVIEDEVAAFESEAIEEFIEEPVAAERPHKAPVAAEGNLQSKLTDVRARADEARLAKLKANVALYEGLSAAYDFALDAEDSPEEYLRLVEGAGLKIQLRAPMRPVVKLAFDGLCDDATIAQLEAVLAWAIDQELPRGTLARHIEEAGGIGPILNGLPRAA